MQNPSSTLRVVSGGEQSLSRLQRRIRLFEFIGIGLTAILVGLATLIPMYEQLKRNADLAASYRVRTQAQAAGQLIANFSSITAQITSRSQIRDALEHYNEGRISRTELEAFSIPRLQDALERSPLVVGLLRLDRSGYPAVAIGKTIPEALWRIPPTEAGGLQQYGPFQLLGQEVLVVSAPIVTREGARLGTDIVAFDFSVLREAFFAAGEMPQVPAAGLAQAYLFERGDRYLVRLLPDGREFVAATADDPVRAALRGMDEHADGVVPIPGDDGRVLFVAGIPGAGNWQLAVAMERIALYAGAGRELLWPLAAIVLLMLASGGLMLVAVRPLSRRFAEQSQHLALAASIFGSSGEGILLLDAERCIIGLNPAGCRLLLCSEHELRGRRFCSLCLGDVEASDGLAIWRAVEDKGRWQGEMPLRRPDGTAFEAWLSLACVRDDKGSVTHYSGIFVDISARKEAESRIRVLAYHDELTGLPNRILMQDRLGHALHQARRAHKRVALLFLDLDRFKPVNDSYGHAAGDRLLQLVAERLRMTVREGDTVARVHGDEFVVIVEDIDSPEPAARVAGKIVTALGRPFQLDERRIEIGTSIGIAVYPDHAEEPDALLRCADSAMYCAKQSGRNGYRFYVADGPSEPPEPPDAA